MQTNSNLLIFSRYPSPGETKTRLIPALGPAGAARLQRRMTESIVDTARTAAPPNGVTITVSYHGASRKKFQNWLGADLDFRKQARGDLGRRMLAAFEYSLQKKTGPVIGIGSDIPSITPKILKQAGQSLADHDIVIGPAADGGYYLIGLRALHPGLFADIAWGSDQVYQQTRAVCSRLGLKVAELPELADIDRPEDLPKIAGDIRFKDVLTEQPSVSVVIPTLNEAERIEATLERLQPSAQTEVIVVDGGSTDQTREIAVRCGAKVIEVTTGRAAQLNAGAAASQNSCLLFLHADTLVPAGFNKLIDVALSSPATAAGAFRFATDTSGLPMRLVEWGTNLRSAWLQLPYGDQGLFMQKRIFEQIGGFPDLPIMEDFVLVRKLRRRGRIITLKQTAQTSARRWRNLGILRTTLINQLMVIGFLCGVPPARLRRIYRGRSKSS